MRSPVLASPKKLTFTLALLLVACGGAAPSRHVQAAPATTAHVDSAWDRVLSAHVEQGLVDYLALKNDSTDLDAAVVALADADLSGASREEQVAFWLNAYNTLVLARVVEAYPIAGTKPGFPTNSVLQLEGFFDGTKTQVAGRQLTLNELEKTVLLGELKEPLSHFALVCAAGSCPSLRGEPFRAPELDRQLKEQVTAFLADPRRNLLPAGPGLVRLSRLFDWYQSDFAGFSTQEAALQRSHGAGLAGVLILAREHLGAEAAETIESPDLRVEFMDYDWGLNDQAWPPANLR